MPAAPPFLINLSPISLLVFSCNDGPSLFMQDIGQPVLIGGSMGTASYILLGTDTAMKVGGGGVVGMGMGASVWLWVGSGSESVLYPPPSGPALSHLSATCRPCPGLCRRPLVAPATEQAGP